MSVTKAAIYTMIVQLRNHRLVHGEESIKSSRYSYRRTAHQSYMWRHSQLPGLFFCQEALPQRCLCLREYRFFFEALSRERESREANALNISYIYSRQISAPIPIFYIWNDPALGLGLGVARWEFGSQMHAPLVLMRSVFTSYTV